MSGLRSTAAEVDLDAIRHNVGVLLPDAAALMAVVKADGYGHGAAAVAGAALQAGASWLGVALVEEGLALRQAGIEAPILILSEPSPGSESIVIAARLTPTLYSEGGLDRMAVAAHGAAVAVHVKVDTGMHRVGVWPPEHAAGFVGRVGAAGLDPEGLWTHFASASDPLETGVQMDRFGAVVDEVRAAGFAPRLVHAANSAATILHPETHLDMVRTGIAVFGIAPEPGIGADLGLRPALSWRSTVSHVKRLSAGERVSYGLRYALPADAWVATVPVGYADGYPRAVSGAQVLVGGRRCPIAGSVTMDQVMVDCADVAIEPGEEVVLLGAQGADRIDAWELAAWAGTIGYEIVSRLGPRVPRRYRG